MLPPERGFRRDANAQPVGGPQQLSTIQKVVRFAEKDDLLLYITALFGIVMPAVMYFFYKTMHAKYHAYQSKKKHEKQRELAAKRRKRTITIFYCGANSPTKRIAYNLAEEIDQFDPVVAKLSSGDINRRIKESSRAVLIFIVSAEDSQQIPEPLNAFLDWLDEVRYEHRQKAFMRGVSFAVFSVNETVADCLGADGSTHQESVAAKTLHTKLSSLQGHAIQQVCLANFSQQDDVETKLKQFSADLAYALKQFQYGAYDDRSREPYTSEEDCDDDAETENESMSSDGGWQK